MRRIALAVTIAGIAPIAAPAAAAAATLDSAAIRDNVVGRSVFLATPFGGEFPLNYRRSGQVDGDGEALGLGRFVRPQDTGRWWINGDRLCQRFTTWYEGRPMCFELTRIGPNRLRWVRDNGETGTARIGGALSN
jgi:hypothetical protein